MGEIEEKKERRKKKERREERRVFLCEKQKLWHVKENRANRIPIE